MTAPRLRRLALFAVSAALTACGGGRAYVPDRLPPPAEAVSVDPGRRCDYVDEPGELPALGRMIPAAARTALDLWGDAGDLSDTLHVSIRYGPGGELEWVRVIGDPERAAELERILTRAVPREARPEWGVRLAVAADGTPVAVLPAVVCQPQPLAQTPTASPVPTPNQVAEMRRARGRRAEVRVLLDDRGHVLDAEIARTSGSRLVDAFALAAARNTTFRPGLHDGFPVTALATLRFGVDRP